MASEYGGGGFGELGAVGFQSFGALTRRSRASRVQGFRDSGF